jgi:hypothetical protein
MLLFGFSSGSFSVTEPRIVSSDPGSPVVVPTIRYVTCCSGARLPMVQIRLLTTQFTSGLVPSEELTTTPE